MRLLLIEDELKLAGFIQEGLAQDAFAVDVARDGETGLLYARATTYDLIILDVMMPGIDGFEVCRELRRLGSKVPILILSARGMVVDRVTGLDVGADDYLAKPFAFAEFERPCSRAEAIFKPRFATSLPHV